MTFGKKIRRLRKERRITQADMAKELGISARAYQNYEEGRTLPKDSSIYQKISIFFDVSVDYLLDDSEPLAPTAADAPPSRTRLQAQRILEATEALYAGGLLSDEDRDAFHEHLQRIYYRAKERAAQPD